VFSQIIQADMDEEHFVEDVVVLIVAMVWCHAVVQQTSTDGRSCRRPRRNKITYRNKVWTTVKDDPRREAWFPKHLRCSKRTFYKILEAINNSWMTLFAMPRPNTHFDISFRLALTLHYLSSAGGIQEAASLFGCSKTSAVRYIDQILVVAKLLSKRTIRLPRSIDEWEEIAKGFQSVRNFPDVAGAIDGTLIEIQRPEDHEGWYCRKGFPAINMQAIVNHKRQFISYSMGSGSRNDKSLWSSSTFGKNNESAIPPGMHLIGDSGYRLLPNLLTPYSDDTVSVAARRYNFCHSSTRMCVEIAFGRLKNRFRILMRPLAEKSLRQTCKVVIACMTFHNLFEENDDDSFGLQIPDPHFGQHVHTLNAGVDDGRLLYWAKDKRDDIASTL
jgi:hypothetical protein